MWDEDPREYIEQMFDVLSGIFVWSRAQGGYGFVDREQRRQWEKERRGTWMGELRCQQCGKYMDGSLVRSGKKWCSQACKQKAKHQRKKEKMTKKEAGKIVKSNPVMAAQLLKAANTVFEHVMKNVADALSAAPTPEIIVEIRAQLQTWEGQLKHSADLTKELIKEYLKTVGETTTDKGTRVARIGRYQAEMRPTRTGLDAKKVEALLRAKELSVETYMDKEIIYKVNETRLESAVKEEVLTKDELEACKYDSSYSLQPLKLIKE